MGVGVWAKVDPHFVERVSCCQEGNAFKLRIAKKRTGHGLTNRRSDVRLDSSRRSLLLKIVENNNSFLSFTRSPLKVLSIADEATDEKPVING